MYRYRSIDIVEFLGDVDVRELDDATEIESHLLSIPDVKSLMTRRFQKKTSIFLVTYFIESWKGNL